MAVEGLSLKEWRKNIEKYCITMVQESLKKIDKFSNWNQIKPVI